MGENSVIYVDPDEIMSTIGQELMDVENINLGEGPWVIVKAPSTYWINNILFQACSSSKWSTK